MLLSGLGGQTRLVGKTVDFVHDACSAKIGRPNGMAFIAGMLNGAFTIGSPDAVTHMAEEMPSPRKDLPKAIAAQLISGAISKQCGQSTSISQAEDFQLLSGLHFRGGDHVRRH
jgi:hypothetical protein